MGSFVNPNLHMTNILTVTFVQITKCYLIQQRIGKAIGSINQIQPSVRGVHTFKSVRQAKPYEVVTRHVWQEYYEEAEHLRYVPEHRELYELRKQTIERNFADLKEKHGLRWTNYRGLERNQMQAMLVCAAINLKKLANYMWRRGLSFLLYSSVHLFWFIHQETQLSKWNKMVIRQPSYHHLSTV